MKQITLDEDSVIADIETANTGGHVYVDYVTLKDGTIIGISDEVIIAYRTWDDIYDNKQIGHIYLV